MSDIRKTGQHGAGNPINQRHSLKINEKLLQQFNQLVKEARKLESNDALSTEFITTKIPKGRAEIPDPDPFYIIMETLMNLASQRYQFYGQILARVLSTEPKTSVKLYLIKQFHDKPWLAKCFMLNFIHDEGPISNITAKEFLNLTACNEREFEEVMQLFKKLNERFNDLDDAFCQKQSKLSLTQREQGRAANKFFKQNYPTISKCLRIVKAKSRKKTHRARAANEQKRMPAKSADRAAAKETFENGGRKPYRPEGERGPKTRWLREFFKLPKW